MTDEEHHADQVEDPHEQRHRLQDLVREELQDLVKGELQDLVSYSNLWFILTLAIWLPPACLLFSSAALVFLSLSWEWVLWDTWMSEYTGL